MIAITEHGHFEYFEILSNPTDIQIHVVEIFLSQITNFGIRLLINSNRTFIFKRVLLLLSF